MICNEENGKKDGHDDIVFKRIECQNILLTTRLEQAENNEMLLMKKIKSLEDNSSEKQHVAKISQLELALQHKTTLLIEALKDKG